MNSLLRWRSGAKADCAQLSQFRCTTDPVKNLATRWQPVHPRMWEWEVHCAVRGLRPPCRLPNQMLVGYDDVGLAAVSVYREEDGPRVVELSLMALALRLRRKGGGYADEMCRVTLDALTARAVDKGVPEVRVLGYVFEDNHPSQEMCRRHGLRHTDMAGEGVQVWSRRIPVEV